MPHPSPVQPELSIIVPVLNEANAITGQLTHLDHWRQRGAEMVIVDGGSTDQTAEIARLPFTTPVVFARRHQASRERRSDSGAYI